MLIRHFDPFGRRVPDPMRPGRTAVVTELRPSKVTSLNYTNADGSTVTVEPRADGWFDVPEEVGERLCRIRTPGARGVGGGGFYTDAEVDERYGLGYIAEPVAPNRDIRDNASEDDLDDDPDEVDASEDDLDDEG